MFPESSIACVTVNEADKPPHTHVSTSIYIYISTFRVLSEEGGGVLNDVSLPLHASTIQHGAFY